MADVAPRIAEFRRKLDQRVGEMDTFTNKSPARVMENEDLMTKATVIFRVLRGVYQRQERDRQGIPIMPDFLPVLIGFTALQRQLRLCGDLISGPMYYPIVMAIFDAFSASLGFINELIDYTNMSREEVKELEKQLSIQAPANYENRQTSQRPSQANEDELKTKVAKVADNLRDRVADMTGYKRKNPGRLVPNEAIIDLVLGIFAVLDDKGSAACKVPSRYHLIL